MLIKSKFSPVNLKLRLVVEILLFGLGAILVYLISARIDLAEDIYDFFVRHEHLELDEVISVLLYCFAAAVAIVVLRWREALAAVRREHRLNLKLQQAMEEINQLEGILPVCSYCKRIRDDEGEWQQMERYIRDRSAADFSHGICDDCLKKHFPEDA